MEFAFNSLQEFGVKNDLLSFDRENFSHRLGEFSTEYQQNGISSDKEADRWI